MLERKKLLKKLSVLCFAVCMSICSLPEVAHARNNTDTVLMETNELIVDECSVSEVEENIDIEKDILGEGELAYKPFETATYELTYFVVEKEITITGYTGDVDGQVLVLPEEIGGMKVSAIWQYAFEGCSGFVGELIIPSGVRSIGDAAFLNCSGFVGDLVIPEGVEKVSNSVFANCSGFDGKLVIPNRVTSIGQCTFMGCNGLKGELILPDGITYIGPNAFESCSGFSGELTIPNSITEISEYAFAECSGFNGELLIPDNVRKIQNEAFSGCNGLNKVRIPLNVVYIGENVFYCEDENGSEIIKSICAPRDSYGMRYALESGYIYIEGLFVDSTWEEGKQYEPLQKQKCKPSEDATYELEYVIYDEGVIITGYDGEIGQQQLILPNSLNNMPVISIGTRAFQGARDFCGNLIIPDSVLYIEPAAFERCSNLNGELILPKGLKTIGESAFYYCRNLSGDLLIPNSVTYIGQSAFCDCSGFTGKLELPESMVQIEDWTFYSCNGLSGELNLPENIASIGWYAFCGCSGLTGELILPNGLTYVGENAFSGCKGFSGDLLIPEKMTIIGTSAFSGLSGLDGELVIPETATNIGKYAFYGCENLSGELKIPDGMVHIGACAFEHCAGFEGDLVIPNSVISIGCNAFSQCSGFNGDLVISNNLEVIESMTFYECTGFEGTVIIPKGVKRIEKWAFFECSGFKGNLVIPNSVIYIGDEAFAKCCNFDGDLVIPSSVMTIGRGAFADCNKLSGNIRIRNQEVTIKMQAFYRSDGKGTELLGTIYAPKDSTAERYALENGYTYVEWYDVETLTLDKSKVFLDVGSECELNVNITPGNASDSTLTWRSSDNGVAMVLDGKITALHPGTAVITVMAENGITSTCKITVTEVMNIKLIDVSQSSWQYEPVKFVYQQGVMTGKGLDMNGDVIFAPEEKLTREQFAQVLYSAEGKESITYTGRFADVVNGQWYTEAVLWAEDKGIVSGYGNGKFGVGDSITREQLAAMLYKYAEYKGYNTSARTEFNQFNDANKISTWATEQLSWAVANGVMSGKGEMLDPTGSATRAECAAMLRTFMMNVEE